MKTLQEGFSTLLVCSDLKFLTNQKFISEIFKSKSFQSNSEINFRKTKKKNPCKTNPCYPANKVKLHSRLQKDKSLH